MAYWAQLSGVGSPAPLRQFDGVSRLDAFSLRDTYLTQAKNLTTSGYPALTVR
jgi:hypothetical protein